MNKDKLEKFKEWLYAESVNAYEIYVKAESPSAEEEQSYARSIAMEDAINKLKEFE